MTELPNILYAEDNENDIELTLEAFKQCKLQNRIDVVRDGQQVIDYLKYENEFKSREKEKPVLILLDIKMPKLDGIQTLRALKSDPEFRTIPIVMLTSSSIERDMVESYNLGVNAYVIKPVDFNDFIEAVKKIGSFWALLNRTI
jgi:CheY-like chemotaxis protein